jgi:glycosyltransferase involved in cell wall biosynthesis
MRYLLVNHGSNRSGSIERMENFLISKNETVAKIIHPLDGSVRSYSSFGKDGLTMLMKRKDLGLLSFILDFFLSVKTIRRQKVDRYVGATNFDTIPAIFCRYALMQRIPRIIYYPRDFFEERYDSKFMNWIYYSVEKIAVRYSDITISNTNRAAIKRQEYGLKEYKSKVVPNGVLINNLSFKKKNLRKDKYIYVGDVTIEHGLFDILPFIQFIAKELVIIGRGDDLSRVIEKCDQLQINTVIYYDKSHDFVISFLNEFNGYGLAPYSTYQKWTIYCSPVKVSEYIANGVPVIISDVPEVAKLVNDERLGVVVRNFQEDSFIKSIKEFHAGGFNKKAKWFYEHFNSDVLYAKIFYEN